MTHSSGPRGYVHFRYRGKAFTVTTTGQDNVEDLCKSVAAATGTCLSTIKLIKGKLTSSSARNPHQLVQDTGLLSGTWLLLASSEADVSDIRNSHDLPGLASFDYEDAREASRQWQPSNGTKLPSGSYVFRSFQSWQPPAEVTPAQPHATSLLHQLAADPGVVAIMRSHRWSVGCLAEMPPEGFVGVSPVCILGYNTNKGQSIHLRLRTDDLEGFRRYDRIRDTLLHELAHNVHSDHDIYFKTLNSQLQKEYKRHTESGHFLAGTAHVAAPRGEPTASAPKLYSLGRNTKGAQGAAPMSASAAAAAAALERSRSGFNMDISMDANSRSGLRSSETEILVESDSKLAPVELTDIEGLGHRDRATEKDEKSMAALESLPTAQQHSVPPLMTQLCNDSGESAEGEAAADEASPPLKGPQSASNPAKDDATALNCLRGDTDGAPVAMDVDETEVQSSSQSRDLSALTGGDTAAAAAAASDFTSDVLPPAISRQDDHQHTPSLPGQQESEDPTLSSPPSSGASSESSSGRGCSSPPEAASALKSPTTTGDDSCVEAQLRLARFWEVLQLLQSAATDAAQLQTALHSLQKILQNVLSMPEDARVRRIRDQNPAFRQRLGCLSPAVDFLKLAGFERSQEDHESVLKLRRNDPGLIWLALAAVKDQAAKAY